MADSSSEQSQYQHETTDINGRSIVKLAITLIVIIISISFILFGLTTYFKNREPITFAQNQKEAHREEIPPLPHLEEESGAGLKKLRQEKEHLLHSYGWVDKKKKIIHIPIENAMKLLVIKKTSIP
ncbi:MAG: hypothetical protein ACU4EQ_05565 [Candidatus Nitrosoglobus sp.]|jgi:hypothetical protein